MSAFLLSKETLMQGSGFRIEDCGFRILVFEAWGFGFRTCFCVARLQGCGVRPQV